ncbi:MAG: ribosome recycling factor [Anaerolineales bacterium]|nr:ribosome recycling factor [Anaerolineales bacterium]
MVKETLLEAENKMKSAEKTLEESFASLRTGRASPMLVEKLMVDYYDVPTPLMQLATISAPEPRLLAIKPFDPTSIKTIEKGILASDLGLTPNNDGKIIRLSIPALTEDRRKDLAKIVHHRAEEARIAIRNVRRDSHNDLREFEKEKIISEDDLKRSEDDLQKLTDRMIEKVDAAVERKTREIMEV